MDNQLKAGAEKQLSLVRIMGAGGADINYGRNYEAAIEAGWVLLFEAPPPPPPLCCVHFLISNQTFGHIFSA